MKLFDFFESRDMCNVCGQTPCNCTHITESVANPGRRLIELFNLIYRNGGDDAVDYLLYNSPIFADYYDQYEGDLESIAAEVGPKELAVMVDELEEVAENEGLAENVDIGKEWMSDTELDQYVPDALEQEWRELVGYNEDGNAHPLWINMTGDYEPRSSDPQHRAWMVKVANKWFAKKKIPNVTFFDVRDHDTEDELEWLVQIGQQGVAEGYDTEELANEVYAEFERTYPNLARRADERTIHAAIVDVLNYGGDNDAGALAQDVARAVKQQMQQGVAEGSNDTVYPNAEVIKSKNGKPVGEIYQDGNEWGCFHYRADRGYDMIDSREDAIQALKDIHSETGRSRPDYTIKGVAEGGDVPQWRVEQSDATGRYYVVTGYTSKSRRVWKSKQGAGDFNKRSEAEAKAQELNRGMAEGSLNELSPGLLQRAAQGAKVKRDQAMDPEVHSALGGGYMNPLAKHYDTVAKKFGDKAVKAGQRDAVKKIASPAVMRKIGLQGVVEGMPASVIKSKQRYAEMTPTEFAKAHGNKSDEELQAMAWRHGYGKGSNHYVDKRNKGRQGVAEMDKSQPSHGRDGKISHSTYGSRDKQSTVGGKEHTVKAVTAKQASKDALNILKKQGVAEQRITPVAPVLSTQNVRTYPPQQIYTPPSGQSRTPPKPPTSGGGGPKPAAILDIQNVPISETISGLDLADAIFKALNQMEGDVVRQYGHDVVGDAIMDVVDEYGEIGSMSDLDMAVQDVLEKLQSLTKTNVQESRHYFATAGTGAGELRNKFGLRKDSNGWFLSESHENFRKLYLEATRTFTEYDLSKHTVSADTIGDDNFVSPVGSVPRGQQKQKVKKHG